MAEIADVLIELGSIGLWLQTIGIVIILWIALQIGNWVMNRKRLKRLDEFEEKINRVERKLDKIIKNTS
jgi:biopolymer transport protein ExbB/TolQ